MSLSPLRERDSCSRSEQQGEGPTFPTREELLARAKWMRANPTEAEKRMWSLLRAKRLAGWKFKRQLVIYPYIADFVCLARRLIVEADGSQHADSDGDRRRDRWLESQGSRVLRFWNNDIYDETEAVAAAIYGALTAPLPSPPSAALPSPAEGRGISGGALHG
ncbi:MAG: endonuclease domain-containing protein [Allosphingosinicella sp.]